MPHSGHRRRNEGDADKSGDEDIPNDTQRIKIWVNRDRVEQTQNPGSSQSIPSAGTILCNRQLAVNLDVPTEPIGSSQEDNNLYFLETGSYSTCLFNLVDCGAQIPGHHLYFMTRSGWFRREVTNFPHTNDFVINVSGKCTAETFRAFMKCVYTDRLDLDANSAVDILNLAYVFDVHNLILRLSVSNELLSGISVGSVLNVLMIAVNCDLNDLTKVALECISGFAAEVLKQPSFLTLDKKLLLTILQQPELQISGVDLCERIVGWAKSELRRHKLPCHDHYMRHILRQCNIFFSY